MAKQAASSGKKKEHELRISHLHRAAAFLSQTSNGIVKQSSNNFPTVAQDVSNNPNPTRAIPHEGRDLAKNSLARHYLFQLKDVSMKAQVRLPATTKHSMCRRCMAYLDETVSASERTTNPSSDGRKPWADIKVIQCLHCGNEQRIPVGATRQRRRKHRTRDDLAQNSAAAAAPGP